MVAATIFSTGMATVVQAANLYWDGDATAAGNDATTGAGLGGTGTWDTATAEWFSAGTLLNSAWSNSGNDVAYFTGNAGLVTLGEPITVGGLNFITSGYTLSSSTLTLAGSSPSVRVAMGMSATVTSKVSGTGGLTLTGNGVLRLSNVGNDYTGATTINRGMLVISSPAALGSDASAVVVNGSATRGGGGGALVLDGTTAPVSLARDLSLQGLGPITDRSSALVSVGSNVLGGVVTMAQPASGTNVNTRITATDGTLTLSSTSTLNVLGTAATHLSIFGGTNQAGAPYYVINGALTGTGTLEKTGTGTLFLAPSDVSGFSGAIRVTSNSVTGNTGTIRITSPGVIGSRTGTGASSLIDLNAGFLELRMDAPTLQTTGGNNANVYSRSSTTSTFFLDHAPGGEAVNGTLTLGEFGFAAGAVTTFSSRNGYGFTFGAAPVATGDNDATITSSVAGTLTFTGAFWSNTNNGAARSLTIAGAGNTTISGAFTASSTTFNHSLIKTGTGLLTINNQSATLDGTVSVQGSLAIRDIRAIGSATNVESITLGSTTTTSGNLIFGTASAPTAANLTTARPIVLNTTTANNAIYASQSGTTGVTLNGAITIPNGATGSLILGGTNTFDNTITVAIPAGGGASPTNGLIKQGLGTWRLRGVNLYAGATTITAGTLKLAATAASSTLVAEAAGNTVVFDVDSVTQNAGGILEFIGVSGSATTEALGALTPTAGGATIRLTSGGAAAAANLTFTSLGAVGRVSGVNFDVAGGGGGTVTLTGVATTTATTLPGNGHLYFNGNNFAVSTVGVLGAPTYAVGDAIFNDAGGANLLLASRHNQLSSALSAAPGSISLTSLRLGADLTMASTAVLTVNTGAVANDGGILAYANATLAASGTGGGVTTGGAGTLVYQVPSGVTLTQNAPILSTTTGGFTKNGPGVLVIGAANAQTGATTVNEGTLRLGAGGVLSAASAALAVRQGATLDLNGVSTGTAVGALNGAGSIVNGQSGTPAAATLTVGNGTGTGTFTGTIGNGTGGALSVTKVGTGAMSWLGSSTYTGVTTIGSTGLVTVNVLANGGVASGIGQSSAAAANLVFNGSAGGLVYAGGRLNGSLAVGTASASTDRLFTLAASATGATLSSTAALGNAIVWSATGAVDNQTTAAATLVLTGTSTGDNTFNPQLTNSSATGTPALSVSKTAAGQWNLGNVANTYSGSTNIAEGILGLNVAGALSPNSPLTFSAGATTTAGVLQMSGTFERTLAATAVNGSTTVTWASTSTGGGGFAAHATDLVVALGGVGTPAALTWGAGGFVGTGGTQSLFLGSASALAAVDFRNPVNFNGALRTVNIQDNGNTGADFAILSGVLSGTGASGLQKAGSGVLKVTGANTYAGITDVNAGTLVVASLGSSSGGSASAVGASGVAMGNTNAVTIGNGGTGGAILQYVGPGETSDRKIRFNSTTGAPQIHADGAGALILTNVVNDFTTPTGAKTLNLRGSSAAGNAITSNLTNDAGGGSLGVTVDGGATWILSGTNTFTGNLTVGAGAFGVGGSGATGGGQFIHTGGMVFAHGADRTITNSVYTTNNTTTGQAPAFVGDYSLTIANAWVHTNTSVSNTITNGIVSGKVLTLNGGISLTGITATRNLTFNGSGDTVLNVGVSTSTAFGVNTIYSGTGSLTLVGTINPGGGALTLSSGTIRLGANERIPHGTGAASVTINPAAGAAATFDLAGFSETVNGLSASASGDVTLNNSSAGAATLTLGDTDGAVTLGGGAGISSITQSGGGAINLVKLGAGVASFTASNGGVLANTGTTTVNGGILNYNSATGTTGVAVANGGTLNLKGGLTTPASLTAVSLSGGGGLSFANGQGQTLSGLTSLSLGTGSGTAVLELDVGDTGTDALVLASGAATAANAVTLLIKDVDLSNATSYTLISAPGGGLSGASYSLNLAGYTGSSLQATNTSVVLTTGTLITSDVYWNAGASTAAWNTVVTGSPDLTNFSSDAAGTLTSSTLPGKGQKVIFVADSLVGGAALNTTLEQPFKVNALIFRPSATPANTPVSVSIGPGAIATNSLSLVPSSASDGVLLESGAAPTVAISAPVVAQAAQTWTVTDASQALNVSGALSGAGDVTKAGAGTLTLSAAGSGYVGTFTVAAGRFALTTPTALSGVVATPGSGATVRTQGTGAFYYNNATAGTVPNPVIMGGGVLSGGGAAHTYSGPVTVATGTTSTVNLRDQNSPDTTTTNRNITLSGVVSGTGALSLDSIDTDGSGNQLTGNFVLNNAASTWSGALNVNRGTAFFQNVAAGGTATPYYGFAGPINFNQFGRVVYRNVDGGAFSRSGAVTFAAAAVGELQADNVATTLAANYTLTQAGALTLGAGSIARFTLADAASNIVLTGGVVLGGDASFSVNGGDADSLVTIADLGISGSGNLAINDEAGGWGITSGRLAINVASTFIGNSSLTEGTLILGHKDALSSGTFTVAGASTLQAGTDLSASGSGPVPNAVVLNAALTVGGSNSLTLAGDFTGTGGDVNRTLTNSLTAGTLTLSGANVAIGASANNAARTLTFSGAGTTLVSSAVTDGNAFANAFTKAGAGTLTFGAANTYAGTTALDQGTLVYSVAGSQTGAFSFGSATSVTTVGTLDLSAVSMTFGGLVAQTNTGTAHSLIIGAGQTLTIAGNVTLGNGNAASTSTALTATGGGSLRVRNVATPPTLFAVGGSTTGSGFGNRSIVDLGALSSLVVELDPSTGVFRVNPTSPNNVTDKYSILTLPSVGAGSTTVTAATLAVGDSGQNNNGAGQFNQLKLGSGVNAFNVNTVNIGTGNRDAGSVTFSGASGSIVLRAADGVGRAAFNMGTGIANTGVAMPNPNTFDLTGRTADLLIGSLSIGGQNRNTDRTDNFVFDTGTLDVTTVLIGNNNGTAGTTAASNTWTSNLSLGGGSVVIGGGGVDIGRGSVAVTGSDTLVGNLNVSGTAVVTIANSAAFGAAIRMSNNSVATGLTANANVNVTGGSLTLAGHILKGVSTGAGTATVSLNGGTLDLGGNNIGAAGATVTLSAQAGTLANLGELNGGGDLVKSGASTLTLGTANAHSGVTAVTSGVLAVLHGSALGSTTGGTTVTAGAGGVSVLRLQGGITVAGESLQLAVAAGAAGNASLSNLSGNNAWTGDVTVDTGSDPAFRTRFTSDAGVLTVSGNIAFTGAGTRALVFGGAGNGVISGQITGSLPLFKDGAGTWTLSGDSSSTYTGRLTVGNGSVQIASEASLGAAPGSFVANQLTLGDTTNRGVLRSTANASLSANRGVTLAAGGGGFNVAGSTSLTVSSAVAGVGALVKDGVGTLLLAGSNSFTGGVTVNAGLLAIADADALGTGPAAVSSGGVLSLGNLTVTNDLAVASGGTLTGGEGSGSSGADVLSLSGGSILQWEVFNPSTGAGSGYDSLGLTGAFDLSGAAANNKIVLKVISLNASNVQGGIPDGFSKDIIYSFNFATVGSVAYPSGVTSANINDIFSVDLSQFTYSDGSSSSAGLWSIDYDQANGLITLTAVPEPSTYGFAMGALALAAAAIRRRKRQAKA
jgi:autotransporter-associated beta strand protein